jgi:glucose/arabinose dehydrogenase
MLAGAIALAAVIAGCVPTSNLTPVPSSPTPSFPSSSVGGPSASPAATAAATPPEGPFIAANVAVNVTQFAKVNGAALAIAAPEDGTGRLFVATQQGQIWSVGSDGKAAATPMLEIASQITSGGERGLLGIALHPGFPKDPRVFVDYTDLDGNTVVSSFSLTPGKTDRFAPGSEQVILQVEQPFPNHNGGGVVFGPDGNLYIALGDGGSGGDPNGNGQNLDVLLAKMLRIDVDHPSGGKAYGIPADNPFRDRSGARPEIWLYGLRNPFRMSFDRSTGDLWIGDVGQGKWEEIDVVRAGSGGGQNFGWNVTEGNHCYKPADNCKTTGITPPVSEYGHDEGCAVIGGNVYRGAGYPILRGAYLFTDSCSGTIWAIPATTTSIVQAVAVGEISGSPAGFGEDPAGELYVASLSGVIWKVAASSR